MLLVDDVDELRGLVRQALRLRGGFDVVAEAADGTAAVAAAEAHQPQVVVLDLGLPDLAGHELVRRVRHAAPAAQVVVYTGTVVPEHTRIADRVAAFVRKDQDVNYLVELLTDLSRTRHDSATAQLGPELIDVAAARRFISRLCATWNCGPTAADAELVVSELVTNALLHAGATCELRARFAESVLRLEVRDGGPGAPDLQAASNESEHGRGLVLVSALCSAWGIDNQAGGGKVVWAELLVRTDPARTTDEPGARGPVVRSPRGRGREDQHEHSGDAPPEQGGGGLEGHRRTSVAVARPPAQLRRRSQQRGPALRRPLG